MICTTGQDIRHNMPEGLQTSCVGDQKHQYNARGGKMHKSLSLLQPDTLEKRPGQEDMQLYVQR